MKRLTLILFLACSLNLWAQTPVSVTAHTYRNEKGVLFWNKKLPVYIHISTSPDEKGEILNNPKQKIYSNPYYFAKEGSNSFLIKGMVNSTSHKSYSKLYARFPVIVDGRSPKTRPHFLKAPFGKNAKGKYYGVGLKISLSSFDQISGVSVIYFSLDNKEFSKYLDTLTNFADGVHALQYYAVDNVGNQEKTHQLKFWVDTKVPQTTRKIVGEYIPTLETLSERSRIKLFAKDSSSGIQNTKYKIDNLPTKIYECKPLSVANLANGYHTIKYFSTDKVQNIEDTVNYTFYVDKVPPILTSDVLGDRYEVNNQVYFSGRTKFKLICVDNKSGVDSLKYSVDKQAYEDYKGAFYLPRVPGFHYVSYYAKDKFGNKTRADSWEKTEYQTYDYNVKKIYIDLVGPTISAKFTGFYYFVNDTVLLGKDAAINLYGSDAESGLQYISYALDGKKEETKYTKPIKITTHGKHTLEYFGYDNVNNRNIGKLVFYADFIPPKISYFYSIEAIGKKQGLDKFPSNLKIYLSATDVQVGTKIVQYKLNDKAKVTYNKAIVGFSKGKINKLTIYATDNLDNTSEKTIEFYVKRR